jgi:pyridoxal phosphate enzyme (YggS family)
VDKIISLRQSSPHRLEWHCIGPIQSNKTKWVAEYFDWAHTVDRLKIAQRLSDQRPADMPPLNVCIQVNVDGGENKAGVSPADALQLALDVAKLPRLCLRGLMSIPEPAPDFAAQKAVHEQARQLFDDVRAALAAADAQWAQPWNTLSMGMTGDMEAAIHAGSTMVRVGTGIFGGRTYA